MHDNDRPAFARLLTDVLSYYGKDISEFVLGVHWDALKRYDIDAVSRAFSVHAQDPDRGQFAPKPADILRLLEGGAGDKSMVAWTKVEKTIRQVGTYVSVSFDDPIIHAVIADMGGWIELGNVSDKEMPFKAKEFQQRYRAYAMRRQTPAHTSRMIGRVEADELKRGLTPALPVLIGDAKKAALVLKHGGDNNAGLGVTRIAGTVDQVLDKLLTDERTVKETA